jgi:hypothetical protein
MSIKFGISHVLKYEVLKTMFESEGDEVTENRRQLKNEKFHNFYSSLILLW